MSGRILFLLMMAAVAPTLLATPGYFPSDEPIDRFLTHAPHPPDYRGTRHLEAENGSRRGWLDITTEYAAGTGFGIRSPQKADRITCGRRS
jgi:hypothetical protein